METSLTETNIETAKNLGLTEEEYERIITLLGRKPNFNELCMFSAMWSEHCSYKNSILWLKELPKEGPAILAKAGEENAGLVDLGNGWACAFKIESHNHPSAIEPYQGAATGVGGINRDIFTMGARPVAQLNSLRFGDLSLEKTRHLMRGVVKGIGDYGNAFGVPVLAGEVYFDECYNTNPLVNAMSVGLVRPDKTIKAVAYGEGNPVFIVGSDTGKDGIHGASFASKDITDESHEDLPAVQVGDPFQEKLLLEATMELAETDAIVGMQDMGAAGITCSTSEMSAKTGCGMIIWLDKVPTRQEGMQPWEILLSESQERMLVVVKKGKEDIVKNIFKKWEIHCQQIGVVTNDGFLRFYMHDQLVAEVKARNLVLGGDAPQYEREYREPEYYRQAKNFDSKNIAIPENLMEVGKFLASHPNICSKKWVIRQYDTMVGIGNMTTNKPSDAGVYHILNTNQAIAMKVDCNARYIHADPEIGTQIAVFEAARNIVCSGGKPLAITNCLNFGNPYNPEVYWQFVGAIKGMKAACEKLQTPVTGGNVSFYNQTVSGNKEIPVFPTPTIGMIGLIEDLKYHTPLGFQESGHLIYLLGKITDDINCSEYLYSYHRIKLSPAPYFNAEEEFQLQTALYDFIRTGKLVSAHDCSDGGLFITLLEAGLVNHLGFNINTPGHIRKDAFLFGEGQGRVVVSINPENREFFENFFKQRNIPFLQIGQTQENLLEIDHENWGDIADWKKIYEDTLPSILD